ncbi:MAG: Ig-like domain-containing protein [Pseudomonadota bacterium]
MANPTANDDAFFVDSATAGTASVIDVFANDVDLDGDPLTLDNFTMTTTLGTLVSNGDGTFDYTPDGTSGTDSFEYTLGGGGDAAGPATVTIQVQGFPTADDDDFTIQEDTTSSLDVLINDGDPEDDTLTIVSVDGATNGLVSIVEGTSLSYQPNMDFEGIETFTYTISDGNGGTSTATVSVTVEGVNDPPVAVDDSFSGPEDTDITGNVGDNDIEVDDGDELTFSLDSIPMNGTVDLQSDGSFTYTPNGDFSGADVFTYDVTDGEETDSATVMISITSVQDDPIANPDFATTPEDEPINVDVVGNDADPDGDRPFLQAIGAVTNGMAVPNIAGGILFTPDENFVGEATVEYLINDGNGNLAQGLLTIDVTPVNDAPEAVADDVTTNENTSVVISVLANDIDVDADDVLSVLGASDGTNGTTEVNDDGTITYTPNDGFTGTDTFTYDIEDLEGEASTATVTVTVNEEPVAMDDMAETDQNVPVDIDVLENDTDGEGQTLTVIEVTEPANGTAVVNDAGGITYTPDPDFFGMDSFLYTVSDGVGGTDVAAVKVNVIDANDPPEADAPLGDIVALDGQVLTFSIAPGFTDPNGDALTFAASGLPAGVILNASTGEITGTLSNLASSGGPEMDGIYTVSATASDGALTSDPVEFSITVNNPPPVANDDTFAGGSDGPVGGLVGTNDVDPDGDPLTFSLVSGPSGGMLTFNENGSFTYTPGAGTLSDSFVYLLTDIDGGTDTATVTLNIDPSNTPPVAVDDTPTTAEDTAIVIPVLSNDMDADGDLLSVTNVTAAANGVALLQPNGVILYTPDPDFVGTDSFDYEISDGPGGATDTATVTVTVTAVADAPIAADDDASTTEDTAVDIDVLANDSDPDAGDVLNVAVLGAAANGSVSVNSDGTVRYTPNADFTGTDMFTYTVGDGTGLFDQATVTVEVGSENDDPTPADDEATTDEEAAVVIAVLANDSDPDGDPVSLVSAGDGSNGSTSVNADGTVTYTPDVDFFGTDSFTYVVEDGVGGSADATVEVTVNPIQDAPLAADDMVGTAFQTPIVIDVLANDSDPDGDAISVSAVGTSPDGVAVLNEDGTITFTPNDGFFGDASFGYTITDGGLTDDAIVTVNVAEPDNVAPVPAEISETTPEDTALNLDLAAAAFDADGDAIVVSAVMSGGNGSVVIEADGTVTYTPDADFFGADSFDYTIEDPFGASAIGTVNLSVTPVADAPVAVNDEASVGNDQPLVFGTFISNDFDPDGDTLTVIGGGGSLGNVGEFFEVAGGGSAAVNADGTFIFVLGDDFDDLGFLETREVSFDYAIADSTALSDTGTVTIIVDGGGFDDVIVTDPGGTDNELREGGIGDDFLETGEGDDTLLGNGGRDTLDGNGGNDLIIGGGDDDELDGGVGNDTVLGEDGVDVLRGGEGSDSLEGGFGNDKMFGGSDDDTLLGEEGNDALLGDEGNDLLIGGIGNDLLLGGAGNDTIRAGEGTDALLGGADADFFVFNPGDGTNQIADFEIGVDTVVLEAFGPGFGLGSISVAGGVIDTGLGTVITLDGITVDAGNLGTIVDIVDMF